MARATLLTTQAVLLLHRGSLLDPPDTQSPLLGGSAQEYSWLVSSRKLFHTPGSVAQRAQMPHPLSLLPWPGWGSGSRAREVAWPPLPEQCSASQTGSGGLGMR